LAEHVAGTDNTRKVEKKI